MPSSQTDAAHNTTGILWMIAAMAGFAVEDSLIKHISHSLPLAQVLIGFGIGGAVVFAIRARLNHDRLWTADAFGKAMRIRVLFEVTGRLFYTLALAYTALSGTTVILQATPIVVVAGAAIFLGEPVGWRRWTAIGGGLLGVLIVLQPTSDDFSALSLLAVIGMLGFAGRDLASRAAPARLSTDVLGFYGFLTLILAGGFYAFWAPQPFVIPKTATALSLAAAVGVGVFSYASLMKAMRTGQVATVTPFRYIRLIFGISLGVVIFGEPLEPTMMWGSAVIVVAGLFLIHSGSRR